MNDKVVYQFVFRKEDKQKLLEFQRGTTTIPQLLELTRACHCLSVIVGHSVLPKRMVNKAVLVVWLSRFGRVGSVVVVY